MTSRELKLDKIRKYWHSLKKWRWWLVLILFTNVILLAYFINIHVIKEISLVDPKINTLLILMLKIAVGSGFLLGFLFSILFLFAFALGLYQKKLQFLLEEIDRLEKRPNHTIKADEK